MSYILDALRRADAERERGHVPGLHSQPALSSEIAPGSKRSAWPWLAAALLLVAAGAGGGWWLSRPAAAPVVVAAATPKALPPEPVPSAPAVARPAPQRSAPTPAPHAAPAAPRESAPQPAPPVHHDAAPARPAPQAAVAVASAPAATASSPVIAFERLPVDVRRQLPAVPIGGAIYSDNAASRMLIVAGQLLREGDAVAPGVTLEQIKPRSAVLRWKGLHYEVSF